MDVSLDALVLGRQVRHIRKRLGLTLDDLAGRLGKSVSYLSMLENGQREPRLSTLTDLAKALQVSVQELLTAEPPSRRVQMEIEFQRAQDDPLYGELHLPRLHVSSRLPDEALEHMVALFREVRRRSVIRAATPEEARRSNAKLRADMRARGNYFGEIEAEARKVLAAARYSGSGPLSQRDVFDLVSQMGFSVHLSTDIPLAARSITDLRSRRIYVPNRSALPAGATRSVILQTLGHFVLGHGDPTDFGDFLQQRVESNYFAGAVLAPEQAAAPLLQQAKEARDLAIEDIEESFYLSYEMAAHRFTNLATHHLGIETHFVRSDEEGIIWKAYENDGVPFPTDPDGAIEGMHLCRRWGAREAFRSAQTDRHYHYVDMPAGTYWCVTQVEAEASGKKAVTVGVQFDNAWYFRGRNTKNRSRSFCPDAACCRRPPAALADQWDGKAWVATSAHSHVLAALPAGTFPGVDFTDIYEFLDRHLEADADAED